MPWRNIKLTIHYNGRRYHGWQTQPDVLTVEQCITDAVEKLCGERVKITGASRTDAGVSALGQVANFRIESPVPTENFPKALTQMLPEDIAVAAAEEMPEDFDAISCAKNKLYRYTIYTGVVRPVLNVGQCWHYQGTLDVEKMDDAAKLLLGKQDFKSFAAASDTRQSSIRTINRCDVTRENDNIYIEIEADGFLYNMVRNITGTLVEIGRGRWEMQKIKQILQAKDRTAAGPLAPPSGLCLMRIDY